MKTIAFFNNKGGVGKTTLVNHLAWMFHDLGLSVLMLDLDPQANLTSSFLEDDELEPLVDATPPRTILGAVQPLLDQLGDVAPPYVVDIEPRLRLIPGDPALSELDDLLGDAWSSCLDDNPATSEVGRLVTGAFHQIIRLATGGVATDVVFLDLGPALSPLNRAALVACDAVVVPVAADLYALRGLKSLGPRLASWRKGWEARRGGQTCLPNGAMEPAGYIVLSHATRRSGSTRALDRWAQRIPDVFAREVKHREHPASRSIDNDPDCLAIVRNYTSLMPLAREARKPLFHLTARDGALGAHGEAVSRARVEFEAMARRIAAACGVPMPAS